MVEPGDPAFDRLMNYRYCRLMNNRHVFLAGDFKKLREQVKTFQATFENNTFSRDEPILVFDFLTTLVDETDTLGVFYLTLMHF